MKEYQYLQWFVDNVVRLLMSTQSMALSECVACHDNVTVIQVNQYPIHNNYVCVNEEEKKL